MSTGTELGTARLHRGEERREGAEDLHCWAFLSQSNNAMILFGILWALPEGEWDFTLISRPDTHKVGSRSRGDQSSFPSSSWSFWDSCTLVLFSLEIALKLPELLPAAALPWAEYTLPILCWQWSKHFAKEIPEVEISTGLNSPATRFRLPFSISPPPLSPADGPLILKPRERCASGRKQLACQAEQTSATPPGKKGHYRAASSTLLAQNKHLSIPCK